MTTTEQTIETDETTDVQATSPEAVEAPEDAGDEQVEAEDEQAPKGDREAAKLRKRAQSAEADRDALAERVAVLQRTEVERQATGPGLLADGGDLWHGADLDAVMGEDGNVDADLVREAVRELLASKPHYGHRRFQGSADGGMQGQGIEPKPDPWEEAGNAIRRRTK